jgi:hypothetical protein
MTSSFAWTPQLTAAIEARRVTVEVQSATKGQFCVAPVKATLE